MRPAEFKVSAKAAMRCFRHQLAKVGYAIPAAPANAGPLRPERANYPSTAVRCAAVPSCAAKTIQRPCATAVAQTCVAVI